jgi:hypothetical protein
MASFNRGSLKNPQLGALIKGGSGIRKVRVAIGPRGKSRGARVIYHWAMRRDVILLLYAYPIERHRGFDSEADCPLAKVAKQGFGNGKGDV